MHGQQRFTRRTGSPASACWWRKREAFGTDPCFVEQQVKASHSLLAGTRVAAEAAAALQGAAAALQGATAWRERQVGPIGPSHCGSCARCCSSTRFRVQESSKGGDLTTHEGRALREVPVGGPLRPPQRALPLPKRLHRPHMMFGTPPAAAWALQGAGCNRVLQVAAATCCNLQQRAHQSVENCHRGLAVMRWWVGKAINMHALPPAQAATTPPLAPQIVSLRLGQ